MIWLAIAVGGALGAMARYAVTALLIPPSIHRFPFGTLTANVVGSFLMGFCYVLIVERTMLAPQWRHVFMVGFLGAFTTFSTFSLETFSLWQNGHLGTAFSYIVLSVFLCVAAVFLSVTLTQKFL